MSSEERVTLADQQQGESNAGENEELVSKYFAKTEKANSNVDSVAPVVETVNSEVDSMDTTVEKVNSEVDSMDTTVEKVKSEVDSMDTTVEKVNSEVDSVDVTVEKVNSEENAVDTTVEKVNSEVDAVDTTVDKVNSEVDPMDTTVEKVNSEADSVDHSVETVGSKVDSVDHTVEKKDVVVHVIHVENICEEECSKETAAELNDRLPETLENPELEDMIVQRDNTNEESQITETVDLEETDNTHEESQITETIDLEETDNTHEDSQTPEAFELEAKTSTLVASYDVDQSLDTEETTQNLEDAEAAEEEQVQYTAGDFGTPESGSDMERETEEEIGADRNTCLKVSKSSMFSDMEIDADEDMSAGSDNEEENVLSASNTEPDQSTWNVWNTKKGKRKENKEIGEKSKLVKRFSDRDTENYRKGYPGKDDDTDLNDNVRFYKGEIPSSPDGALIDVIHKNWKGNYKLLERHHGYIQWLFPIRENGMNWQAQPLQLHEAEAIKADPKARKRVLESYKLMLDFYGMKLVDEETGKLDRTKNWEPRFDNLNWSSHNFLRITRILKCLGELGYEHLKKGFIQFVLVEALERDTLVQTVSSCQDYWIGTIKNDQDREELYNYIDCFESKNIRKLWKMSSFSSGLRQRVPHFDRQLVCLTWETLPVTMPPRA